MTLAGDDGPQSSILQQIAKLIDNSRAVSSANDFQNSRIMTRYFKRIYNKHQMKRSVDNFRAPKLMRPFIDTEEFETQTAGTGTPLSDDFLQRLCAAYKAAGELLRQE